MLEIRKDRPEKWLHSKYFRSYNTVYRITAIKSVRNNIVTFACNAVGENSSFRTNKEMMFQIEKRDDKVILTNPHYDFYYATKGDYLAALISRRIFIR